MYGSTDADIARVIREGVVDQGMLPYADVLSGEDIQALVIYLREMRQLARAREAEAVGRPEDGVFRSQHHPFKLEKVVELQDDIFWSVSFLPDGAMLLAQFGGQLYVVRDGRLGDPVKGIPQVHRHGQGGLLEAQAHPDYASNGWIYLGYTESSGPNAYMTAVVRGRIRDGQWVDQEDIFRVPAEFHSRAGVHFGTRFVFKNGYLFFSVGDRGQMEQAQDLTRPNGKVHPLIL